MKDKERRGQYLINELCRSHPEWEEQFPQDWQKIAERYIFNMSDKEFDEIMSKFSSMSERGEAKGETKLNNPSENMTADKGIFEFGFAVENLTEEEANKIGDVFIKAVEKYDGRAGGGYHRVPENKEASDPETKKTSVAGGKTPMGASESESTKLKTLKEIPSPKDFERGKFIVIGEYAEYLREEAKKWVEKINEMERVYGISPLAAIIFEHATEEEYQRLNLMQKETLINWIKHFFNLEEEKEEK